MGKRGIYTLAMHTWVADAYLLEYTVCAFHPFLGSDANPQIRILLIEERIASEMIGY